MEEHIRSCPGKKGGKNTQSEEKLAHNYDKLIETTTVQKKQSPMHG